MWGERHHNRHWIQKPSKGTQAEEIHMSLSVSASRPACLLSEWLSMGQVRFITLANTHTHRLIYVTTSEGRCSPLMLQLLWNASSGGSPFSSWDKYKNLPNHTPRILLKSQEKKARDWSFNIQISESPALSRKSQSPPKIKICTLHPLKGSKDRQMTCSVLFTKSLTVTVWDPQRLTSESLCVSECWEFGVVIKFS